MRLILEVFFWAVVSVLHWWLGNAFSSYSVAPDLLFVSMLAFSAFSPMTRGTVWAFIVGLYADMYSGSPLGANAMAYTLLSWGVQIISQRFDLYDHLTQAVIAFVLSWPANIICWLLSVLFSGDSQFSTRYFCLMPVFNAIASPFVFAIVYGIKKAFRLTDRE